MTANGFGYVTIEDGKVKAVIGSSSNPEIHYFENDEIVKAVTFFEKCKKDYPHLWKYTLELIERLKESDKKYADLVAEIKQVVDGGEYFDICDVLKKHEPSSGGSKS